MGDGGGRVELAGFWRRFGAQLIDTLWILPFSILLTLIAEAVNRGEISSLGELMANVVIALVILLLWVERQATPGKRVLGLRIVDAETGGDAPVGRLALRYIGYILSALPLGLGYLWMLWDARKQTWHDKLGGTLVVRDLPR